MSHPAVEQKRETFVVTILGTQNATWQGTVSWTPSGRTVAFRRALELIRLMDGVLSEDPEETREA